MPLILAVDDSPSMRQMVGQTLRAAGYDVATETLAVPVEGLRHVPSAARRRMSSAARGLQAIPACRAGACR